LTPPLLQEDSGDGGWFARLPPELQSVFAMPRSQAAPLLAQSGTDFDQLQRLAGREPECRMEGGLFANLPSRVQLVVRPYLDSR
jgi:hypothetical protein